MANLPPLVSPDHHPREAPFRRGLTMNGGVVKLPDPLFLQEPIVGYHPEARFYAKQFG
jgi:hypothetical protein